jgi:hypothetical protein
MRWRATRDAAADARAARVGVAVARARPGEGSPSVHLPFTCSDGRRFIRRTYGPVVGVGAHPAAAGVREPRAPHVRSTGRDADPNTESRYPCEASPAAPPLLAATALVLAACGGSDEPAAPAPPLPLPPLPRHRPLPPEEPLPAGDLVGAGATFVNPIFVDWIFEYNQVRNPDANINYQSIGSGGGIRQFLEQTVDFGASERYLRAEQLQRARADRGCDAIQFPIVFGSVTIAFNDDFYDELILDGNVIADIFERRITKYNDPAIQALNPGRASCVTRTSSPSSAPTVPAPRRSSRRSSTRTGRSTRASGRSGTAPRSSGRAASSAVRATRVSVRPSSRTRVRSAT